MISLIRGKIIEKNADSVVVDTGAIGYKIFVSIKTLGEVNTSKDEVCFHTYLSVKENALDLFGFTQKNELDFFQLLLGISGIGPKSALAILSSSNVETIISGIQSGDPVYLSKITGLGKKTAEKVMLGLKEKLGVMESKETNSAQSTVIDALVSLGYSERSARETVIKLKTDSPENMIKEALQKLNNK